MASLLASAQSTDVFTDYKPSKNAHVDFLYPPGSKSSGSDASSGVKVIKLAFRAKQAPVTTSDTLPTLLSEIAPLLAGQPTTQSYHHLSATCHHLVLPPHTLGPTIYSRVKDELEASVSVLARGWRGSILAREEGWLERLIAGWKDWEKRVNLLSAVFVYLDRVYSNENNGVASIRDLAIATFRKRIWDNELIFGKTKDDILSWVSEERKAGSPNTALRTTIASLTSLSKLLSTFSTLSIPYISLTESHYQEAAASNIDNDQISPIKYVEWVLEKAIEERDRAEACFSKDVANSAVQVVREEAGRKMGEKVVRRAVDEAMDATDVDALGRLYQFSIDVDVFGQMATAVQAHVEDRLRRVISDPANDPQMIERSLVLKRFADRAVTALFEMERSALKADSTTEDDGDGQEQSAAEVARIQKEASAMVRRRIELEDAIRVGFKAGMGSRQNAPAEWIAKHLDVVMRRGQGSGTEGEFNALLDEIIALIGFTKDKDVFKAFYSTQLAKRLLLNKSASDDMERNMIIKLQNEMGEEFTSGDIMMKDLQLSETLVRTYQAARMKNPGEFKDPGNLTANVLTESAWPAYPQLKKGWDFKLTPDLQASIDAFTAWYGTQHRNRQLSWRHQLATVTLSGRFGSGKYEIGVSLFQAVVLLQFNDEDSLTFEELKERTGIENAELVRTVQSLSMGRKGTRVLVKKPPGKEVNPTDVFAYNKAFTSDRIKFKINQIQQDLSAEESRKTNEQVAVDRVSVLEATIVRIMKGKKKLTLQLLIDQVVGDVSKRFPPDVKEIKKRVESLIEREFLIRDEDDRNLLHYLA